jgi:hypothetical protein
MVHFLVAVAIVFTVVNGLESTLDETCLSRFKQDYGVNMLTVHQENIYATFNNGVSVCKLTFIICVVVSISYLCYCFKICFLGTCTTRCN